MKRKRKKLTAAQRDVKLLAYAQKAVFFQRKVPRATQGYPCKHPSVMNKSGWSIEISYEKWMKDLYGY